MIEHDYDQNNHHYEHTVNQNGDGCPVNDDYDDASYEIIIIIIIIVIIIVSMLLGKQFRAPIMLISVKLPILVYRVNSSQWVLEIILSCDCSLVL